MENEVILFWTNSSDFSLPEPSSNWNRISIFSDERSKARLIICLFRKDFLIFPPSIFSIWECTWLVYLSYIGWQFISANCTFREIGSCFHQNLNYLFLHSNISTDILWFQTHFFKVNCLMYQNLYLSFSHKVGDGLCQFYFWK